ncbi:unnamed protein product [Acanthoscelides obtectus]|uniref:Uncharacterized protein n=1 Tax=Acanthoscelides obtectus TaxID=200917 RepID=A0A9P0VTX2_ACAOB|nr:unnamed protein product [Acanthoscelides obtectus]CAK1682682.1 hypothetical protein AOBTE_LOCUS33788 [Acanthoscelides obtectus]
MCTCGQPNHPGEPCNEHKKCINCEGQHAADSRECPRMKEEVAIQRVRTLEKISYLEAKRKAGIGILTQNQSLNPSSSVTKKAKAILGREQRLENPTATEILDHLKQKLKAMAKSSDGIRKVTQDVNTIVSLAGVKGAFIKFRVRRSRASNPERK